MGSVKLPLFLAQEAQKRQVQGPHGDPQFTGQDVSGQITEVVDDYLFDLIFAQKITVNAQNQISEG
jgi:hypothetical protein